MKSSDDELAESFRKLSLVVNIRLILKESTPEERVLLWDVIREGYCPRCGASIESSQCFCDPAFDE